MALVYLAKRPILFRKIKIINSFFQALYPLKHEPLWDGNENLCRSWLATAMFVLKYHLFQHSKFKSLPSLEAIQLTLLFIQNLKNSQLSILAKRAQTVSLLDEAISTYGQYYDSFEKKESLIHPNYFFSFSGFIAGDAIKFASYYLSAPVDLFAAISMDRNYDLMRILDDTFGVGLHEMKDKFDLENVKKLALAANKLSNGICKEAGSFDELTGQFPQYIDNNGCFIDVVDRIFEPRKSST